MIEVGPGLGDGRCSEALFDLASRAERSLAGVSDPAQVARLYREHDLPERAQAVLISNTKYRHAMCTLMPSFVVIGEEGQTSMGIGNPRSSCRGP